VVGGGKIGVVVSLPVAWVDRLSWVVPVVAGLPVDHRARASGSYFLCWCEVLSRSCVGCGGGGCSLTSDPRELDPSGSVGGPLLFLWPRSMGGSGRFRGAWLDAVWLVRWHGGSRFSQLCNGIAVAWHAASSAAGGRCCWS